VLTETTKIRFVAVRGDRSSAVDEAEFFKLRSDLRVLRLGTKYSNQYTGGGDQALVDLMPGGADFRSGRWQGYEGANLDAVLDLGSKKPVHWVQANFLQDENAWIFYPIRVSIEVSDDGKTFRPAGEVLNDVPHTATGTLQKKFAVECPEGTAARYERVVGHSLIKCPEGHKGAGSLCWIFADEVYVE